MEREMERERYGGRKRFRGRERGRNGRDVEETHSNQVSTCILA